jgi:hypothetical protein
MITLCLCFFASASSLFRRKQPAGENMDEVHLADDDKPLDWNRRPRACRL